jgi:hypothetical protein
MLELSTVLIQEQDLQSFEELLDVIRLRAKTSNERFFRIDVKPPYGDVPENWEDRLEAAFC